MIYLKSILAGLACAIAAVIACALLVAIGTFVWMEFVLRPTGSGGIGSVSAGFAEPTVALSTVLVAVGFVVGFRWEFRRASRLGR